MALTFKLDAAQMEQVTKLTIAVNELSTNLAKWQGQQVTVIQQGFADLVAVLGGTDSEAIQERINELTSHINASSDDVEAAINQSTEGD